LDIFIIEDNVIIFKTKDISIRLSCIPPVASLAP